jgi:hypothetical protein
MSELHDPQNGQHNLDVRYEKTDVNARAVLGFALGLAVWLALVIVVLWYGFLYLLHSENRIKESQFPIAEEYRERTTEDQRLPKTGPIIEGFPGDRPQHTLGRFGLPSAQERINADEAWLAGYGWMDADHSIARIPIAEAMRRIVGKLPARSENPPVARDGADSLPTSSSSGRRTPGGPP